MRLVSSSGEVIEDADPYNDALYQFAGEGGADLIGTTGGGTVQEALTSYTFLTAQAATIDASVQRLKTVGYTTAFDGGHAHYKRVVSEPSHNAKFQDASGQWWELDETEVYVEMLGGGALVADNYQAIMDAAAYLPDRILPAAYSAGPRAYHGTEAIRFRTAGPYRFSQKLELAAADAIVLYSGIENRTMLKYEGTGEVAIVFAPGGAQSAYGIDGVDVFGGCVAFVGGANGGLRLKRANLSHSRGRQVWLTDAALYHDEDYPAVDIAGFTIGGANVPVRVQTSAAHGLTDADYFGLTDCLGEERLNGKFYAKVIDATHVDLYSNAGLTTAVDEYALIGSADKVYQAVEAPPVPANLTSGLLTKGYPVAAPSSGWNTVWMDIDDITISSCLGEGMVVESSTYLLLKLGRMRFNFTGKTPLVLDCNGYTVDYAEVQAIASANVTTSSYIHHRCRHNAPSYGTIREVRFGPEDTTVFPAGPDGGSSSYAPPTRYICFGPLDGTPARWSGSEVTYDRLYGFGENGASADTQYLLDENASINGLHIKDGYISGITVAVVKGTAAAAGRAVGGGKRIERGVDYQASTIAAWFSGAGLNWDNEITGEVKVSGADKAGMVLTPQSGMGIAGTLSILAGNNDRCFTLTINTAPSAISSNNVCTITLPSRFQKTPIVSITAADAVSASYALGAQITGAGPTGRILNVKSGSVLPVSTTLKYYFSVLEPA